MTNPTDEPIPPAISTAILGFHIPARVKFCRRVAVREYLNALDKAAAALWRRRNRSRSLTSLKEKLIKIGAKVVSHGRYVAFQMAEVAIPKNLFADILRLIAELRPPPASATA